jgi:hypothetical protein
VHHYATRPTILQIGRHRRFYRSELERWLARQRAYSAYDWRISGGSRP